MKNLRSQISLVTQDIFLFADSIFNNITLFNPNISIDDVKKAAKEIGIHGFINKLPGGYYYNVRERVWGRLFCFALPWLFKSVAVLTSSSAALAIAKQSQTQASIAFMGRVLRPYEALKDLTLVWGPT